MVIVGLTDAGRRAGVNQDTIGWSQGRAVAMVADGLGGHQGGQVASAIVKRSMLETGAPDLRAAVLGAHTAIVEAAERQADLRGMASTVVAVRVARRTAHIIWVGDSRAYLWRENELTRLTRDHSVVEVLRDVVGLSETQVHIHPQRNEVTNVLGAGDAVPSMTDILLQHGDWILLCSDGLHGELRDEEIAQVLRLTPSLAEAPQRLIAAALEHGGQDNVSAVLIQYDGRNWRRFSPRLSEVGVNWLAALGGVLLAALVAAIVVWYRRRN